MTSTLYGFVLEEEDEDCIENNMTHKEDYKFYTTVPKIKNNIIDEDHYNLLINLLEKIEYI